MFSKCCSKNRQVVYGVLGTSTINQNTINCANGTGFMITPGVIVTAAHLTHQGNDFSKPTHQTFEVIRVPDIGQQMEKATLISEDLIQDIALLKVINTKSKKYLKLHAKKIAIGTNCGSIGFPLAQVMFTQGKKNFNLTERFQGSNISGFVNPRDPSGRSISFYETDALMYSGSSGCPGFTKNGKVFGMHVKAMIQGKKDQADKQDDERQL